MNIEDELLKKFKEEAVKKFGYTRGVLSIATREALRKWIESESERKKTLEKFSRILRDVSGIWTDEESSKFVRRIRRESEKRLKRMGL